MLPCPWQLADVPSLDVLRSTRSAHLSHLRGRSRHLGLAGEDQERARLQDDRREDQAGDPVVPDWAFAGRGQEDGILGRQGESRYDIQRISSESG
jgi:hypothetical protein